MPHKPPVITTTVTTTTTTTIKASELLNATHTATYLGITLRTLFRWINIGKIQPIKIEGHLFFARDALKKLKSSQEELKKLKSRGKCGKPTS